jgi:hypothetical protein
LHFTALELEPVELRVYTDASFANNTDLSPHLGSTIFMVDKKSKCSLIHWSSRKARRVTRTTMAAELFAFLHGIDIGVALQDLVSEIKIQHVGYYSLRQWTPAWKCG